MIPSNSTTFTRSLSSCKANRVWEVLNSPELLSMHCHNQFKMGCKSVPQPVLDERECAECTLIFNTAEHLDTSYFGELQKLSNVKLKQTISIDSTPNCCAGFSSRSRVNAACAFDIIVTLNIPASKLSFAQDMIGFTVSASDKPSEIVRALFQKCCFKMSKCVSKDWL